MFVLKSIPKHRVWGTERLEKYSTEPLKGKIGSVYTASGIEEINSIIDGEKDCGLNELVKSNPELFGLIEGEEFPLIISFTAADLDLSIQVHPTDKYAQKEELLPYGKSEAWFFITEPLNKEIIAGQIAKTEVQFKEAVKNKEYEHVLGKERVESEDIVYIPSGTIHALTKGSLVYEIQQSTDITYRFYDYDRLDTDGRKRELHTTKALATFDYKKNVFKKKFTIGTTLETKEFSVKRAILKGDYQNINLIVQIITLLASESIVNGQKVLKGQSILVLPNEKIVIDKPVECMIATPKMYWRKTS